MQIQVMSEFDYKKILSEHPFLSYITYGGNEYIGIIQNVDPLVTSIYDYGAIKDLELKIQFLTLGGIWWWESNRNIPINLFLKHEWAQYTQTLRVLSNKDVTILSGPQVSLTEMVQRRSKRRSITLVRKTN
jgi:hypothetical protein